MIGARSLRVRIMLLFCSVVGVLLVASYLAFYAVLSRAVRAQFDRRLFEAASPVVADLTKDPQEQDVNELNIPNEYFEVLDRSGGVLQISKNLQGHPLELDEANLDAAEAVFRTLEDESRGRLRFVLVPFQQLGEPRLLGLAMPTRDVDETLANFRRMILLFLPLSLLLTGAISAWYAGHSLQPIADLTQQAGLIAGGVRGRLSDTIHLEQGLRTPLPVPNPHDELGRLATTFNQLFARVESALRQLRQFVSDASHELRTPLSVLQGETELLLSELRSPEEYRKTLKVIDGELKKLSRIVEGLFTLALADAGQLRLAKEPVYLNELLEETCALVTPRAQAKSIAIERDLKQEVPYSGDDVFLRQLFLIFLENAIKYSPANTRVRVNLEQSDGSIQTRFQDQGMGISSEHLPHIFERFYRAAKDGAGESQSGGLGLAIAQAIASAHGGSIDCASAPGVGSTFTVRLPLQPGSASSVR